MSNAELIIFLTFKILLHTLRAIRNYNESAQLFVYRAVDGYIPFTFAQGYEQPFHTII